MVRTGSKAAAGRMRISPRPTKPGFTLVEVLVALVVLALISGVLARILQGSLHAHGLQRDQIEILREQSETRALQFAGELEDAVISIEPVEEEP